MRFERSLRRVYCEPWLILPTMHRTISSVLQRHVAGEVPDFAKEMMDEDEDEGMTIDDGVARISVRGVISKDISNMERMSGAVDIRDIEKLINTAAADPTVRAIILDVDSPGGTVQGVPELAARIAEVNNTKPIVAYTDGLMASAAYWLSSGAEVILASASSTVGSIGVYLAMLDESRAYELAGYKVDVIKSDQSPLKAAGIPGTALTEAQRAELQASVDYLYGLFSGHISEHRASVGRAAMQGQTFFGAQAVSAKLVDYVADFGGAQKTAISLAKQRNMKRK